MSEEFNSTKAYFWKMPIQIFFVHFYKMILNMQDGYEILIPYPSLSKNIFFLIMKKDMLSRTKCKKFDSSGTMRKKYFAVELEMTSFTTINFFYNS